MKKIDTLTEKVGLPVCVDDGSGSCEESDTIFVVAGNGFFKVVDTGDMRAVFSIGELPNTPGMSPGLKWNGPKLPLSHLMFLKKMMFDFSDKHNGIELDVHIFYSEDLGWWYGIPYQVVSGVSTDWDTDKGYVWLHDFVRVENAPVERLRKIGNIHSHHSMAPAWSSKDDNLHKTSEYGIQFVVGNKNSGFGVGCRLVMNGLYKDVPMDEIVDLSDIPSFEIPHDIYRTADESRAENDARKQLDNLKRRDGKGRRGNGDRSPWSGREDNFATMCRQMGWSFSDHDPQGPFAPDMDPDEELFTSGRGD